MLLSGRSPVSAANQDQPDRRNIEPRGDGCPDGNAFGRAIGVKRRPQRDFPHEQA